ncbi:MAG: LptF/LptG family permease [Bacteroidetes bacterium]|nr:LptF/LptG family permease [Bacteroidota bacterium]MBL7104507.1 LptF/LptG family permease [Bacteroidales bacterium]
MKKIYWLIIRSYVGPLLMTFFIALFIILMQFLWRYIDDLVGKGLEWYVITELLFYASSTFVPLALPLAILLSSLMTFGNLGEHYELVAMKAAGISLRKIMMPLIVLSVIISLIAFYFSNNVLPIANLKFKSLLYDIRQQKLALDIKEGIFYTDLDGFVIRVEKKDKDNNNMIRDIMIYDHRQKKGNTNLTVADSGRMELTPDGMNLIFTLYNGYNYQEKTDQRGYKKTNPYQRTKFREEFRKFNLMDFELSRTNEDLFKSNYSMLNLRQLKKAEDSLMTQLNNRKEKIPVSMKKNFYFFNRIDSAKQATFSTDKLYTTNLLESKTKHEKIKIIDEATNRCRRVRDNLSFNKKDFESRNKLIFKHQAEWHRKFTLSFACFVLFFIGAPLGAIIRKGGLGLPVVVSVLFFVLFHIISITGEKSVKSGVIDANIGMWIAPVVLLPLGIFLTYKATTDSPLLDADAWIKIFKKVFKRKNVL